MFIRGKRAPALTCAALVACILLATEHARAAVTVTCPANITAECTSAAGTPVSFGVPVIEDTGVAVTVNVDSDNDGMYDDGTVVIPAGAPGNTVGTANFTFSFAMVGAGPTIHTVGVQAVGADTQTCSFTVTIQDTTPPTTTCPPNVVGVECTGPSGAAVTFANPTVTDTCDPAPTFTCVPVSGSVFAIGTTTVTCTGTDASGNTSQCTFTVQVVDTTPPTITCPADIASNTCDVTFADPTATDLCDPAPTVVCVPASGSGFPVGTTVVTCTATDAAGNASNCTFNVTVTDTTRPTITCPADITVPCTGPGRRTVVTYPPAIATDDCDPSPTITYNRPSGSLFRIGTRRVRATATDASGNTRRCTFFVTVTDLTPPVVTCPANMTLEGTSPAGAQAIFGGVITDDCDRRPDATYSPLTPGAIFPLGTTTVTMNGTDFAGNAALPCSFTVTVQDTTAPVVQGPGPVYLEATGASGAVLPITTTATATDAVDPSPSITYSPLGPGDTFPLGTTLVTATATDVSGNSRSSVFTVRVRDTIAPAITCPADQVLECTSSSGAAATYTPTATDAVDGSPTITCTPASGSTLAVGIHTVSCTATDASGNSATCTFLVTVQDTTAPALTCNAHIVVPRTSAAGANVTYAIPAGATATDACDPSPSVVPSRASGSLFPVGSTTVVVTGTDAAGNMSSCSFVVIVQ